MDSSGYNDIRNIKVAVFGDSIAKGIILRSDLNKYGLINLDVNKILESQNNIEIDNYSKMGCTVTKGLSIVERHQDKLAEYDAVFLEFGGNDCDFNWAEVSDYPDKNHLSKTPIEEFVEKYTKIIDIIKEHKGNPIALSLPPLNPKKYFKWFSARLNKRNIMRWLGDINMIYRWQEMYNLQVAELCNTLRVPFINMRGVFLQNNHYTDLLCEDGIHPNEKGHELIYRTIARHYRELAFSY
jgi:lysophospholipase L1-like esterase